MPDADGRPTPWLGRGVVRHARVAPRAHAFDAPTAFMLLPMRRLRASPWPALARNHRAWWSFHDADHGDGGADALAWCEALLAAHGLADPRGEIWLQTFPRVAGYAFKPVSFWLAVRDDGSLRAVVAEVHSTFGERHAYVLAGDGIGWGRELAAAKAMHVSPFESVRGGYRFRFMHRPGAPGRPPRFVARVELRDDDGRIVLATSVGGELRALDQPAIRAALARLPLLSLGVTARIHWQALRLALKRVPWFVKPDAAPAASSRGGPSAPAGERLRATG